MFAWKNKVHPCTRPHWSSTNSWVVYTQYIGSKFIAAARTCKNLLHAWGCQGKTAEYSCVCMYVCVRAGGEGEPFEKEFRSCCTLTLHRLVRMRRSGALEVATSTAATRRKLGVASLHCDRNSLQRPRLRRWSTMAGTVLKLHRCLMQGLMNVSRGQIVWSL